MKLEITYLFSFFAAVLQFSLEMIRKIKEEKENYEVAKEKVGIEDLPGESEEQIKEMIHSLIMEIKA